MGGIFNAMVAPLIFSTVLEYPLTLVLACLLMLELVALKRIDLIPDENRDRQRLLLSLGARMQGGH